LLLLLPPCTLNTLKTVSSSLTCRSQHYSCICNCIIGWHQLVATAVSAIINLHCNSTQHPAAAAASHTLLTPSTTTSIILAHCLLSNFKGCQHAGHHQQPHHALLKAVVAAAGPVFHIVLRLLLYLPQLQKVSTAGSAGQCASIVGMVV
jgi:hypothetical protein